MVSMGADAVKERQQKLLSLLLEEPRTIKEMQAVFESSYYTLRNDFIALKEADMIVSCGVRGGSKVYTANKDATTGWPMVFSNASATQGRSLKNELNHIRRENFIPDGVRSAFILQQMVAHVFTYANDTRTGQYDRKVVENRRMEMKTAIDSVEQMLHRAKSLYASDECWTRAGLERIAAIDDFPTKQQIALLEEHELPITTDAFLAMVATIHKEQKDAAQRVLSGGNSSGAG